jgi:hypothetical protein
VANEVLAPDRSWGPADAFAATAGRLRGYVEREALAIAIIGCWLSLLVLQVPNLLGPDSWFSLVGGRYVAQHGLPHVDSLTYWTLGHRWVDQQWAGQLLLYEVAAHSGVLAAALFGIACIGVALLIAAFAARRMGASARSTAIGAALPMLTAPWSAQLRAQTVALPLFVAVFALLAADSRRPGRRVLLTLPLLVVWANLHGSVALGAGLVSVYALTLLRRAPGRGALLLAGAIVTPLASPYSLDLVGYYRVMLLHPPLATYVSEWQPPAFGALTAIFFVTALGSAALWGAHRKRLTVFEQWATVVLLVVSLLAVRNVIWFGLALAVSFPRLLDAAWPSRIELTPAVRRVNVLLACLGVAAVVAAVGVQAAKPSPMMRNGHPPSAAAKIAAAAGPDGYVIADELDSDWLLWEQPSLAGRLAYDVRFELLDTRQLRQIALLDRVSHPVWRRCGSRARVVTFGGPQYLKVARREGVLAPGAHVIVETPRLVAVQQPAVRGFCKV